MILLLFILVSAQALPYYSPYPQVSSDSVDATKTVGASLSVIEPKNVTFRPTDEWKLNAQKAGSDIAFGVPIESVFSVHKMIAEQEELSSHLKPLQLNVVGLSGAGPMMPPPPVPSMPQPIRVDIVDSNTGQKLGTHNMVPIAAVGYQQAGVPQYSIQYLTFDGNLAPYGSNTVYREPHSLSGYPMQLIQFPHFAFPNNGIYGRPMKKH